MFSVAPRGVDMVGRRELCEIAGQNMTVTKHGFRSRPRTEKASARFACKWLRAPATTEIALTGIHRPGMIPRADFEAILLASGAWPRCPLATTRTFIEPRGGSLAGRLLDRCITADWP